MRRGGGAKVKGKTIKRFRHRRNPAYVEWMHNFGCAICGWRPVEAAHVRSRGAGGDDVGNIVPLCAAHHREQHTRGIKTFQTKYRIDLTHLASLYGSRWQYVCDLLALPSTGEWGQDEPVPE